MAWDVMQECGRRMIPFSEEIKLNLPKGVSNCHAHTVGAGNLTYQPYVTVIPLLSNTCVSLSNFSLLLFGQKLFQTFFGAQMAL